MPRPQFIKIDGKYVCVVKPKGKTSKKSKSHQKIAAYQRDNARGKQEQTTTKVDDNGKT